ncbi:LysR family transcriptional regulator [Nakamurella alba]|uniref:LysR family transcriptional regulator n=1 Tax=Nakamurella alba TaxID=2665158 RepID=UPI002AC35EC5|nr:LysR family transcriptional regulator [Nakamurella alba]
MTLQQLEYFLASVRHGSFSAAAQALWIAQPSLSEQIKRLETELGVPLFIRTNRRLVLTEAGRLFAPRAEQALAATRAAAESVRQVRELVGGTAVLGTFSSARHLVVTDLIEQFRVRHPQIRVRIVGLNSSEVADEVRSGELEAGLVALPVDDRGLTVGPVVWSAAVVHLSVAPPTAGPIDVRTLAARPLILPEARWGAADPTRRQLVDRFQRAGLTLAPEIEVESPQSALELAARGVADTVLTLPLARALGAVPGLHATPLDPPLAENFAFVTRRDAVLSPATLALTRLATELLAALR